MEVVVEDEEAFEIEGAEDEDAEEISLSDIEFYGKSIEDYISQFSTTIPVSN